VTLVDEYEACNPFPLSLVDVTWRRSKCSVTSSSEYLSVGCSSTGYPSQDAREDDVNCLSGRWMIITQ